MRDFLCKNLASAAIGILLASAGVAAQLDPGGVSVDLNKCEYSKAVGVSEGLLDSNNKPLPQWISVRATPMAFLDNVVCIPEKAPGPVSFTFRNIKKERPKPAVLVVKVPESFTLEGNTRRLKKLESKNENGFNIYRFEDLSHALNAEYSILYSGSVLLLKSDLPSGDKLYPMEYWLEYENSKTIPFVTNLKVIPYFKGEQPRIFKTGCIASTDVDYGAGSAELFTELYKNSGFNAIHTQGYLSLMQVMKKAGIERYWETWWFSDGYNLGREKKPENAKFRLVNGDPFTMIGNREGLCPVEAYNNGEYFQKHVIGYAEDIVFKQDLAEHIMSNWEPYMFDAKGCFCDRCKEEFIKYIRLSREEVDKKWPAAIIESYKAQWVKFRSWQHGRLMEALQKGFDKLGEKYGRKLYLVPEISWASLFNECADMFGEYSPFDYIDKMQWIEPWGPYIYHQYTAPYNHKLALHMNTYIAARIMKERVEAFIKEPAKRPKLIAFPHGFQCGNWVTEPEAISFETIAFFMSGWDGSFAYLFPQGYDYRYWKALALAHDSIARYENFVFKGRPCKDIVIKAETPVPGPADRDETSTRGSQVIIKDVQAEPLITGKCFQLDDKRFAGIGNFWQNGEAFASLQISGLDDKVKYVLWQPEQKRCFGNEKGEAALTAAELKKGILLHVGALRWEFFTIEPYQSGKNYGEIVKPSWMEKEKELRLPNIKAAYAQEVQRKKESSEVVTYNFGELPEVNSNKISAKPRDGMTSSVLRISATNYSLDLDMGGGGRISNWKCGDVSLTDSAISSDAFWAPASAVAIIASSYKLLDMSAVKDGIKVVLERKITSKDNQTLRGLVLNKVFEFRQDGFSVSTGIKNTSAKNVNIAFRFHSLPGLLEKGSVSMLNTNGAEPAVYKRGVKPVFFRNSVNSNSVAPFELPVVCEFTGSKACLQASDSKAKLNVEFQEAKDLKGFVYWDAESMKVCSFEALFNPCELAPGAVKTYSAKWNLSK